MRFGGQGRQKELTQQLRAARRRLALPFAGALLLTACAAAQPAAVRAPQTPADISISMPADFSDWLKGHYTERVLLFHTYAPMNGGIAFVGDSITEGTDWERAYLDLTIRNYGISGDTTIGLERRLSQIVAARPARLFLLIGTNDLGNDHATPAQIAANYAIILDRLAAELPQTIVYVQSVLPREPRNAEAVREINARLQALAAERGLRYIDIHTPFAVEGGRLDPAVTEDDLHLTEQGYVRWRGIIDDLVYGRAAPAAQ